MAVVAVIPARFASVRFPGKVLADRTGKPIIQHVYERAKLASRVDRVLVAADDQRIADAVQAFGGECVLTKPDHPNGTSRIAEAVERFDVELVVNVQGDEPEIDAVLIDTAVTALAEADDCDMATIAAPFSDSEHPADPNIVKVVRDRRGRALYFSRAWIPFDRDGTRGPESLPLKHIGLYVYRPAFLAKYVTLEPTPLEQSEKLEQLRVLEHGYDIAVAVASTAVHSQGIDTPEQYEEFVKRYTSAASA